MTNSLDGKIALITGGSQGLGYHLAEAFLRAGAMVNICARDVDALHAAVTQLAAIGPVAGQYCDVSDPGAVRYLLNWLSKKHDRLDILVNNAGIQGPVAPLVEADPTEWIYTIEVDLIGPMLLMRGVLPGMIRQGYGKILNLSGGGATGPRPQYSAYAASKAGLVRLTETVAVELEGTGIDVNAVAPGSLPTPMNPDGRDSIANAVDLCVFLASPASNGITGKLISAQWDAWRTWPDHYPSGRDLFTLRRVTP